MKKEMISLTLGNIESRYIEEAELYSADEKRSKSPKAVWRRAAIAVAAVLCVALIGIPAAAGAISGFYRDIIRFDGAVVGLTYENATDEISIEVSEADASGMSVEITLLEMGVKEPYKYLTGGQMALGDFRILDFRGEEVYSAEGIGEQSASIEDGRAVISCVIEQPLSAGEYTLVVESVYGLQKAEQPLKMSGHWEIGFVVGE